MKKIVHLITHDKFTADYINFMKTYLKDYHHTFCITVYSCSKDETIDGKLINEENIIRYSGRKKMAFSRNIRAILKEADKIIVSGIFGQENFIFYWPNNILKKVYLHYWGGDFYQMRTTIPLSLKTRQQWINRQHLISCFKRSGGAIFFHIETEYEEYKKITGITKKIVFSAAMPYNSKKNDLCKKYRNTLTSKTNAEIKIIIGNSATESNEHKFVFELLQHLKNENIEIYCPLSYGNEKYRNEIIFLGKQVFGDKFHPVLEWMNADQYIKFLSTFDIAIFGNNRQQAMGNIDTLLRMGKKIYLQTNTSMYQYFIKTGFKCYDIEAIRYTTIDELISFPEKLSNEKVADSYLTPEYIRNQWVKIFEYDN